MTPDRTKEEILKQNGVEISPESIIADIIIDAQNGVEFNSELYEKMIKRLVEYEVRKALSTQGMKWRDAKDQPMEEGEYFIIHKKGHKSTMYHPGTFSQRWKYEVEKWLDEHPTSLQQEGGLREALERIKEWSELNKQDVPFVIADHALSSSPKPDNQ
jgi:hypothetical protein